MIFIIIFIIAIGGGMCATIFFFGQHKKRQDDQMASYHQAIVSRYNAWCQQVASVGGVAPITSYIIPDFLLESNELFYDLDPNATQFWTEIVTLTDKSGVMIHNGQFSTYLDTSTTKSHEETKVTRGILAITNQRIVFAKESSVRTWNISTLLGCGADNDVLRIIPSYGGEAKYFRTADAMIMAKMIKIFRCKNPAAFCAHFPIDKRLEYVLSL